MDRAWRSGAFAFIPSKLYIILVKTTGSLLSELRKRKNNVRFRELEKILESSGFEIRKSGKRSSHFVFSHPRLVTNVVLVSHGRNDILKSYQVLDAIQALEELDERI